MFTDEFTWSEDDAECPVIYTQVLLRRNRKLPHGAAVMRRFGDARRWPDIQKIDKRKRNGKAQSSNT